LLQSGLDDAGFVKSRKDPPVSDEPLVPLFEHGNGLSRSWLALTESDREFEGSARHGIRNGNQRDDDTRHGDSLSHFHS
jgi:hypothetical protein